jgi:hypothetical protein
MKKLNKRRLFLLTTIAATLLLSGCGAHQYTHLGHHHYARTHYIAPVVSAPVHLHPRVVTIPTPNVLTVPTYSNYQPIVTYAPSCLYGERCL